MALSAVARADDLGALADPATVGLSAPRLARIAAWCAAQAESLKPSDPVVPGAVVAIAKDGKLAYLQAIGFQDRARTTPDATRFDLLDRLDDQADHQRRSDDSGVDSLAGLPLAHQPGEVWEYSWGVDVLARVLEVASGEPFDRFLNPQLFSPQRMVDTGFVVPPENLPRLVEWPAPRNPRFDVVTGAILNPGPSEQIGIKYE